MSIIGEFEIGDCSDTGSQTANLDLDNAQNFSLGLNDFDQYCTQTDLNTNHPKNISVTQDDGIEKSGHSDLLGAQNL